MHPIISSASYPRFLSAFCISALLIMQKRSVEGPWYARGNATGEDAISESTGGSEVDST